MSVYDHSLYVVTLDGETIDDWNDATDCFNSTPVSEKGTLTEGINSYVFVASNKEARQVVISLLQSSPNSISLQKKMDMQDYNMATFPPMTMQTKNIITGDVETYSGGHFTTGTPVVRGNGHNPDVWTIVFAKYDIKRGTKQL